MTEEEEDEIETDYKGPEKEEPEYEEEIIDTERGQNEAGADIDKLTNLIWIYKHVVERLSHLVNTMKSSISKKQKAAVIEQMEDAIQDVIEAKKRIDEYRIEMMDATPAADELETSLNEQAELAISDAKRILKLGKITKKKK